MKMKQEHFEHMQRAIESTNTFRMTEDYESGNFPRSARTKDIGLRFRHDCLHAAGLTQWVCDTLYPYLDDTHIDTALRRICPTLTRRF